MLLLSTFQAVNIQTQFLFLKFDYNDENIVFIEAIKDFLLVSCSQQSMCISKNKWLCWILLNYRLCMWVT